MYSKVRNIKYDPYQGHRLCSSYGFCENHLLRRVCVSIFDKFKVRKSLFCPQCSI